MRQLIVNKNPDKKGLITIEGKDFHYLRQVLRVKAGDMVNLRLADGSLQNSTACKIDDQAKTITLQVYEGHDEPSNVIQFSLFQFIPKPQKFELIVRQATECGIKNIFPVISEYAQKGNVEALYGKKIERLDRIIREARQQSGSPVETRIFEPVTVVQAVEIWNEMKDYFENQHKSAGFVLSERVPPESIDALSDLKRNKPQNVCIFCGNEGGISPDELELLTQKARLRQVHFSVNILRCETAALYGIAAVQSAILGM